MNKQICLVGIVLLLCSPVFAGDKYALLIGVSKYEHAEMRELQFAEEDAKALGDLLKSGGYDVEMLLGKSATQKAILGKLGKLNRKGSADGVALIGLFGHGVEITVRNDKNQIVRDDSGKEVNEGCFCPFDSGVQLALDERGKSRLSDTGKPLTEPDPTTVVKLSEIMHRLTVAKSGNRVVLADCCRTIPNQARGRSFGASFKINDLPKNTSVLFGCSEGEEAFEHPNWGHGAFTKCLLDELPVLIKDGDANTGVLAARLQKKVPVLVSSVASNGKQRPRTFVTDIVDLQLASLSTSKPTTIPPPSTKPFVPSQPTKPEPPPISGFEGTSAGDRKELNGIAFRWCPAGTFMMGSPKTELNYDNKHFEDEDQVSVTLTSGFWLGETEVTQGQWQKLMGTTPWKGDSKVTEGLEYPATHVSYNDAVAACQKLTSEEFVAGRLPKGWKYSLPTEAQWEYACRAGTTTKFSFGDDESKLKDYGWFNTNTGNNPERVGQKKANGWELKDMHGNVYEWCSDLYGSKLPGGRNPSGPISGKYRVNRGGSWSHRAVDCRSAFRGDDSPASRFKYLGFRLAAVSE